MISLLLTLVITTTITPDADIDYLGALLCESVWLSPRTVKALGRPRQLEMFRGDT